MEEELPPLFPPSTLLVMRALCALTVLYPGEEGQVILTKALDELFESFWKYHMPSHEERVLAEILGNIIGEGKTREGTGTVRSVGHIY